MGQFVDVPWGTRELKVSIPDSWRILGVLKPENVPACTSPEDILREKLMNPSGVTGLKHRDLSTSKILIVVDDISRPTPVDRFFGIVLEQLLAAGAKKENISILLALGVHRPMTREEVEGKVGAKNLEGLVWYNHDAKDLSGLVYLGTTSRGTEVRLNRKLTEADLILCLGGIEPHVLVGFSGGLKVILPGCASAETIARNHLQGVSHERFNLVGVRPEDSPMRLDLEEAALMLKKEIFIVNAVLNHNKEICEFFCGDPVQAHRMGVVLSERVHGVSITAPADAVMVGSSPMDTDLRQSMKCIGNTLFSVKPGGHIVGFLRCEQGVGDVELPPRSLPHSVLRMLLRIIGPSRIMGFVDRVKKQAGVEEKFLAHFSLQVCRRNPIHVFSEKLPEGIGKKTGLFAQYSDPSRMIASVARKVPQNATVWFFPYGGLIYPILARS